MVVRANSVSLFESRFVLDSDAERGAMATPSFDSIISSKLLTQDDVSELRVFEGQSDESIAQLLDMGSNAKDFGRATLKALSSIADPLVLRYVLQLVEDALLPDLPSNSSKVFSEADRVPEGDLLGGEVTTPAAPRAEEGTVRLCIAPFVKLSGSSDSKVKGKALYLAALLFSVSGAFPEQDEERKATLSTICDGLDSKASLETMSASLQALSVALRSPVVRAEFAQRKGITLLTRLAEGIKSMSEECQYTLVLCIWLACFEDESADAVDLPGVRTLTSVLRGDSRKNVVRLALATLRILLSQNKEKEQIISEALIELKMPKQLKLLSDKAAINSDDELMEDLEYITDTLVTNFKVLTTFERHEQELLSGQLRPNMIHEEMFWKENAMFFQHNNFSSVKMLVDLLKSEDEQTVAVACSDLGYFVQYFPNGKLIVNKYHGKEIIYNILQTTANPEIKKVALTACSKIMITNWESVNKANQNS